MNEREASIDTYFLVHRDVLTALHEYTNERMEAAPADKLTSFDFVQDDDIPPQVGEAERRLDQAVKVAGALEHFMRKRQQAEKVEQLYRSNPFYTVEDIEAMMRCLEMDRPETIGYRSVEYTDELLLTMVTLYAKDKKAYAQRTIIQKMDEVISETYTITYADGQPVAIRKKIDARSDDAMEPQGSPKELNDFLAKIDFDERPSALDLRNLARYIRDFPSLWEY